MAATGGRGGPLQRLVGWLVGGLMMASPVLPTAALAAPAPRIPVVLTATRALAGPLPATPAATAVAAPEPELPTYVVHTWLERRDCLWNIAERYLGDPFRWTEIRDLNSDRVQPDGRTLGAEPRSWVYPGWSLVLPPDASGPDVVRTASVPAPSPATPASSSSAPTRPAVPEAPPAATVATLPTATTVSTPATTAASAGPATTAAAPTPTQGGSATTASPAPPPSPVQSTTPAASTPAAASSQGRAVGVNPWAQRAALAGALGLPLFALGGWLRRLRRGRAVQASVCRPGRDVVRPADPDAEVLERRARAIAADQAEEWVDAALRALTAALADGDVAAPEVRCVRAGDFGIEVLLADACAAAPEGWEAVDGGHVWRPSPALRLADLRALGAEHPALTPALVSLGATPEGPLLADLEGMGMLAVDGDVDRVRAFLAGVTLELSSATWAEGVVLRLHGLSGLENLDAAQPDAAELVREVRAASALAAEGLAVHGSALAARTDHEAESWYPMVVVVGPDADTRLLEDLAPLAIPGGGVAVVAAGASSAAEWQLVVAPDGAAVLTPLALRLRVGGVAVDAPAASPAPSEPAAPEPDPVDLEEAELRLDQAGLDQTVIASALHALASAEEVGDVAPPTPLVAPSRGAPSLRRREDCEVWVSILRRTPEVTGAAKEASGRRKLAEVFIYLAIYGAQRPVPAAELRTNCWPPKLDEPAPPGAPARLRDITADAFHQAMSRLRRQLGEGVGGWHLPLAVDGTYAPGAGVGCDWVLFQGLVHAAASAARHDVGAAIALYREALELVEGEPFADVAPGSFGWADSKHLITDIQLAVSKAASDLGKLAMATDPETAAWAAQQGLRLLPTQLELFDTWMTAAAEMGDAGALDQCVQAKVWAHEQLDPDGGVAPETMELYRRLKAQMAGRELAGHA
ncbi:MAG: BTAD domain-containing putative transcriptional regulator [Acidimicrobiia bacterium]